MKFYQPVEISDRAYLLEAALWVALGRVPQFSSDQDGNDVRGDLDKHDEYYSHFEDDLFFEGEFAAVGHSIDFERYFHALIHDPGFRDRAAMLAHFEQMSRIPGLESTPSKRDIEEVTYVEECNNLIAPLIERAKVQILDRLMTGTLAATGLLVTRGEDPVDSEVPNDPEGREDAELVIIATEMREIPQSYWSIDGVDWQDSALFYGDTEYVLVFFKFADVAECFPSPLIGSDPLSGDKFGETFCVMDEEPMRAAPLTRGRGRPPKATGSIRSVVRNLFGERIKRGDVPGKNEALYQEVIEFVETAFHEKISRSTAQHYVRDMLPNVKKNSAGK